MEQAVKVICVSASVFLVLCRLLDVAGQNTPLQDAFLLADDVLKQASLFAEQSLPILLLTSGHLASRQIQIAVHLITGRLIFGVRLTLGIFCG